MSSSTSSTVWNRLPFTTTRVLGRGHRITGPAVVEAPTTTVALPRGTTAVVDRLGNLVIRYDTDPSPMAASTTGKEA